jgi:hypothetical protein
MHLLSSPGVQGDPSAHSMEAGYVHSSTLGAGEAQVHLEAFLSQVTRSFGSQPFLIEQT